jgi:hypothetical protein
MVHKMDNSIRPVLMKKIIQRLLIIILGTIVFVAIRMIYIDKKTPFLSNMPVEPFLISFAVFLLILSIILLIEFKYRHGRSTYEYEQKVIQLRNKRPNIYFIAGVSMLTVYGLDFIARKESHYISLIIGLILLVYGIMMKQIKELIRKII